MHSFFSARIIKMSLAMRGFLWVRDGDKYQNVDTQQIISSNEFKEGNADVPIRGRCTQQVHVSEKEDTVPPFTSSASSASSTSSTSSTSVEYTEPTSVGPNPAGNDHAQCSLGESACNTITYVLRFVLKWVFYITLIAMMLHGFQYFFIPAIVK